MKPAIISSLGSRNMKESKPTTLLTIVATIKATRIHSETQESRLRSNHDEEKSHLVHRSTSKRSSANIAPGIQLPSTLHLLTFCTLTNRIRTHMDIIVAFTQEYFRVSFPLRNVSIFSMFLFHPRTPHNP